MEISLAGDGGKHARPDGNSSNSAYTHLSRGLGADSNQNLVCGETQAATSWRTNGNRNWVVYPFPEDD